MTESPIDRLERALFAVHDGAGGAAADPATMSFARMLVAARRLDAHGERCPERTRRRAHALFDRLPSGLWETVATMVFDSWQQLTPAARSAGGERLMVFESGVGSLDLQLVRGALGDASTLAVAVQGGGDALEARVLLDGEDAGVLALDEHGSGSMEIAASHAEAVVVVRDSDGEVLRTPVVPLR